jgi:hypothetical protein
MKLTTRIKRYPIESVLIGGLVITVILDLPHILRQIGLSGELRATAEAQNQRHMEMRLAQQAAADASEIAQERYQNGCLVILSKTDKDQYASIVEGRPVNDKSGSIVPQNTIVCDGYGNTAKISMIRGIPVATQVAFTGNRKAIENARKFHAAVYSTQN